MSTDRHVPTYPLCDDTCTTDCGHCKGNHDLTRTAADQAPVTDSERVEKTLRVHAYRIAYETPGSTVFGCWGCDWQGDSSSIATHQADMLAVAVVNPLLALLAEQAATIERVRGLHKADRGMPNACCECGTRFPCETITALGSQRTEGQG